MAPSPARLRAFPEERRGPHLATKTMVHRSLWAGVKAVRAGGLVDRLSARYKFWRERLGEQTFRNTLTARKSRKKIFAESIRLRDALAALGIARRLEGNALTRLSPSRKKAIIAAFDVLGSVKAAAALFGLPAADVSLVLGEAGKSVAAHPLTPKQRETLAQLQALERKARLEGMSPEQVRAGRKAIEAARGFDHVQWLMRVHGQQQGLDFLDYANLPRPIQRRRAPNALSAEERAQIVVNSKRSLESAVRSVLGRSKAYASMTPGEVAGWVAWLQPRVAEDLGFSDEARLRKEPGTQVYASARRRLKRQLRSEKPKKRKRKLRAGEVPRGKRGTLTTLDAPMGEDAPSRKDVLPARPEVDVTDAHIHAFIEKIAPLAKLDERDRVILLGELTGKPRSITAASMGITSVGIAARLRRIRGRLSRAQNEIRELL